MDPNREWNIRRAAQIRGEVYDQRRRARENQKAIQRFFSGSRSGRKSAEGSGGGWGVLLVGVILGAVFLGHGGSKTDAPTNTIAAPTVTASPTDTSVPALTPLAAPDSPSFRAPIPERTPPVRTPASDLNPVSQEYSVQPNAELSVSDTDAQLLHRVDPKYPPQALRQNHEGEVSVAVTIGTDGHVVEARVAASSGHQELDRSAVAAVEKWTFSPAIAQGHAVESQLVVPLAFHLAAQ